MQCRLLQFLLAVCSCQVGCGMWGRLLSFFVLCCAGAVLCGGWGRGSIGTSWDGSQMLEGWF